MANYIGPSGPNLKKIGDDANNAMIAAASQESQGDFRNKVAGLQSLAGNGGFGGGAPSGSPLAARMAQISAQRMGDIQGGEDRMNPLQFAARNAGAQGLADKNKALADRQKDLDDMLKAQRDAKRAAFTKGLITTAGAGAGAMIGGPAGAQIGAGLAGSMYE